jgi:DNA-binding LytR/AlgR family response regulator
MNPNLTNKLYLCSYDELYVINLDELLYLEADDHYTNVCCTNGDSYMVPYGLSKIEQKITEKLGAGSHIIRLGRKYVINTHRLVRCSTIKEQLHLHNDLGEKVVLHISKPVLRSLIELLNGKMNEGISQ